MQGLEVEVLVFDPALPFQSIGVASPGMDTWHDYTLITRQLRERLHHIKEGEAKELALSGGMSMRVPSIEIGIQVGTIKISNALVLVVDDGYHEILLGSDFVNRAFSVGKSDNENVSVSTPWTEDITALSLELFPLKMPFDIIKLQKYLDAQRRLYNLLFIVDHRLKFETVEALNEAIDDDIGIPPDSVLQLSAIASGSIWIGLKSGSLAALRRLAALFDTTATAKLAQQMADAKKAETQAGISEDTRNATVSNLIAEQDRLRSENIRKTYDVWRREFKARIKLIDNLILELNDDKMRDELIRQKDKAIFDLANQSLLPMVTNIPKPYEPGSDIILIGAPSKGGAANESPL